MNDARDESGEERLERQDQQRQKASLSHRLKVAARVFELSSANTMIDHPVCSDCFHRVFEGMEQRLSEMSQESKVYQQTLAELEGARMEDVWELKNLVEKVLASYW